MTDTTKVSHTPGPWRLRDAGKGWEMDATNNWRGFAIINGNVDKELHEIGRANARLIVEAPAMLEALRECYANLDAALHGTRQPHHTFKLAAKVRELLARVEGKP